MKKLSELMLEGYSMVGQQCRDDYFNGEDSRAPCSVCAAGAAYLAATGDADAWSYTSEVVERFLGEFYDAVGVYVSDLNDEGMSIPDIAGIAAAEGL